MLNFDNSKNKVIEWRRKSTTLFIFVLLFFVLIFILNRLYPLYADDWGYIYSQNSSVLSQIYQRLLDQYFSWGGRTVVHAIAHLLSWAGLLVSDLVNSAAYVFYLYIVYCICNKGRQTDALLFLILGLVLWLVLPAFNNTVLWLVGTANYLWGTLIVIAYLYLYYSFYITDRTYNNHIYLLLFFLGGIIAGWTNENMFVAQVFFIVAMFVLLRYRKRAVPLWFICGFVGVCVGGAFMVLAPGNYIRSEFVNESMGLADKSFIENVLYRVLKVGYRYLVYVLPLSVIYSVLFFLYKKQVKDGLRNKTLCGSLLFFVSAHVACLSMAASPIFPPRAIFGIVTLIVIASGILFANLEFSKYKIKNVSLIIISVLSLWSVIDYYNKYKNVHFLSERFKEREMYIETQKKQGNKDIVLKDKITLPAKYEFEDLSSDSQFWLNKKYAVFHAVDSVKVIQ